MRTIWRGSHRRAGAKVNWSQLDSEYISANQLRFFGFSLAKRGVPYILSNSELRCMDSLCMDSLRIDYWHAAHLRFNAKLKNLDFF